ncbi:MAG: leucine-rich repeat protein [Clostridia bacterium]|nr:leucine-rich repeat protein [Clostridia bacterium]
MNSNTAKTERLLYALTYIDECLILESAPKKKTKKHRFPLKALSIAASFIVVISALSAAWIYTIINNNPSSSGPGTITDPADESFSGSCGDGLSWHLEAKHPLVISGNGTMYDYSDDNPAPWIKYRESVKSVTVENGVTSIGSMAFADCTDMISIVIAKSVEYIASDAFVGCSDFYIVCDKNSYASRYAEENAIPFTLPNGEDTENDTTNSDDVSNALSPDSETYVVEFGTEGIDILACLEEAGALKGENGIIHLKANDSVIEISRESYTTLNETNYDFKMLSVRLNGRTKVFEEPIPIGGNQKNLLYQTKDYFVHSVLGIYSRDVIIWTENETIELSPPITDPDENPSFYNEPCYVYQIDETGRLTYFMKPYKFYLIGGEYGYLLPYICSFDELYAEEGYITVGEGRVIYHPEKRSSVAESIGDTVYELFELYSQNNWLPSDEFDTLDDLMEYNKTNYEEFKYNPDLSPYF